jgi:hypothetical protein
MKKIILIFALMFAYAISEAQVATLYGKENQTYFEYTTDFTITTNTPKYVNFYPLSDWYTAQSLTVALDTIGGVANHTTVSVQLAGRLSDQFTTWTSIGSPVVWHVTTADTVLNILNATENAYKQFRVGFTGSSGATMVSTIENVELQLFYADPD